MVRNGHLMALLFEQRKVGLLVTMLHHAWIDDEKANELNINLFEDQMMHIGQIVGTWALLTL